MSSELRKPRRVLSLVGFVILTLTGCESELPPGNVRQTIELGTLPPVVSKAAAKALPQVKFEDAWKNVDRESKALHSYEVRGRDKNGKVREVRVSATGEVLEME
jgi:hypothetical protein